MVLYFQFLFTIQTINVAVELNVGCLWHHFLKPLCAKSQTLHSPVCQDSQNLTGTVEPLVYSKTFFWALVSHMINTLTNVTS